MKKNKETNVSIDINKLKEIDSSIDINRLNYNILQSKTSLIITFIFTIISRIIKSILLSGIFGILVGFIIGIILWLFGMNDPRSAILIIAAIITCFFVSID